MQIYNYPQQPALITQQKVTHILKFVAWRNPVASKYVGQLPESKWRPCC